MDYFKQLGKEKYWVKRKRGKQICLPKVLRLKMNNKDKWQYAKAMKIANDNAERKQNAEIESVRRIRQIKYGL